MSRVRRYREDYTYGEWHREELPWLYGRIAHRTKMVDRDWTEFCHWCCEPLGLYEATRDKGQDLNDKSSWVTRRVAERAGLPAFLFAWRVDRPRAVDAELHRLYLRERELEEQYPIQGFRAKQLTPIPGPIVHMTAAEWAEQGILVLHRGHHHRCSRAHGREVPVNLDRLREARARSQLWTPEDQLRLDAA
jgi:hypothetical protein